MKKDGNRISLTIKEADEIRGKAKKRRANLLYKLRRKGIEADTKQRVIFIPYGEEPYKHIQVVRLCREFNFNIQFIIT